jgi:alpha-1,6-mannosyltransferase
MKNNNNNNNRSRRVGFVVAAAVLFCSFLFDLILCPHSKVEESFPLQATHDLYYHGLSPILSSASLFGNNTAYELPYDHLQYPGGKLLLTFFSAYSAFLFSQIVVETYSIHSLFFFFY